MQNLTWLLNASAIGIGILACTVPLLLKAAQRSRKLPGREDDQLDPMKLIERRLDYADSKILQYENDSTVNGYIKGMLLIGQYVIGALLTSAFVQRSLPADIVGAAGLLVLVCSTWNERFRPDLKEKGAKKRAQLLRAIRMTVDNSLTELRSGLLGAASTSDLLEKVTQRISEVEASEAEEG
jgi:hypothetical protein